MEISLFELAAGRAGIVKNIHGGRGFAQRMAEMGISAGTVVRVIRGGGPVIIEAGGHRLVIGRGMVNRIMVEPVGE